MNKIVIGLGNTGSVIVRDLAKSGINNVSLYAIDSQTKHISLDTVTKVKYIPIVADDNDGSGRNRERGRAMYLYNDKANRLDQVYDECKNADIVFVVTSAAGGTGSGSCPVLCRNLFARCSDSTQVIPIVICPNMDDPDAYHYNTNDLMVELKEAGIGPYVIFRNPKSVDYKNINKEIVETLDILLGNRFDTTECDSIDASDLQNILNTNGRMFILSAEGDSAEDVHKKLAKNLVSSYQPTWDPDGIGYGVAAFSLKSITANQDFDTVFEDIYPKIEHCMDRYKNVVVAENDGKTTATIIVTGLPPVEVKEITTEYSETASIGDNLTKTTRPDFMKRKHRSFKESDFTAKDEELLNNYFKNSSK